MGTLGVGRNEAFIYDKEGQRQIAPLPGMTSLSWSRNLNAISEAAVEVATTGHEDCCDVLGRLGTWGHSLVIFRDGERCWEGPLTNIRWRRGAVSLAAKDVLGWSLRRTIAAARLQANPVYVINEGDFDINAIFSEHDPNVLDHLQVIGAGTGPQVTRDVKPYGGYADDQINELVKGGLHYTTVGRRIILWPSTSIIGRLPTLLPTEHISGDVEVEEDGMNLTTRAIGVNDEGVSGVAAGSVAVDGFYGQVEQIVSYDGTTAGSLAATAEQYREAHYPAPVSINVPAGAVLSCDAPYSIGDLVCGSLLTVKIDSGLCRLVEATQQLSEVSVAQDASGEKVAVTVTPVSGVLT